MNEQQEEPAAEGGALNQVRLRGRLAADPAERELPSGAHIVTVRLVMSRDQTVMTRGSRQRSDWVECTAWSSALRRKAAGWQPGDVVEVTGSLRRRHFRGGGDGGGGSSLLDVEILEARRVQRHAAVEGSGRARVV